MIYRLNYILFFISFGLFAQNEGLTNTIKINIEPITSSRVILYSAEGAQQKYISYADSNDGRFNLSISNTLNKGMYRLVYDQKSMNYIDFLYLGTSFSLHFDPTNLNLDPVFIDSEENTRYFSNSNTIRLKQQKIDSLQVLYFQAQDSLVLQDLNNQYAIYSKELATILKTYESEKNLLIKDLLVANTRIQPEEPIKNPEEYLPFVKNHFFDAIDFNNTSLIYSSVLIDKVMDYVFYLTISRDPETQDNLYKEAVTHVVGKMENSVLKAGFIQALIQSFAKEENIVLTDFLFENYYDKLSLEFQNTDFKTAMQLELQTAIGRTAKEISWIEGEKTIKLSELDGYNNYIIVFWSTTCPHCLKEIPKLYEFTNDNERIKVIAIGMETEESQNSWKSETYYYPRFTHILGLGKWENPVARSYNVFATPNYFVLDADKKIIAKPYELVDLEVFFKGLKQLDKQ